MSGSFRVRVVKLAQPAVPLVTGGFHSGVGLEFPARPGVRVRPPTRRKILVPNGSRVFIALDDPSTVSGPSV